MIGRNAPEAKKSESSAYDGGGIDPPPPRPCPYALNVLQFVVRIL